MYNKISRMICHIYVYGQQIISFNSTINNYLPVEVKELALIELMAKNEMCILFRLIMIYLCSGRLFVTPSVFRSILPLTTSKYTFQ